MQHNLPPSAVTASSAPLAFQGQQNHPENKQPSFPRQDPITWCSNDQSNMNSTCALQSYIPNRTLSANSQYSAVFAAISVDTSHYAEPGMDGEHPSLPSSLYSKYNHTSDKNVSNRVSMDDEDIFGETMKGNSSTHKRKQEYSQTCRVKKRPRAESFSDKIKTLEPINENLKQEQARLKREFSDLWIIAHKSICPRLDDWKQSYGQLPWAQWIDYPKYQDGFLTLHAFERATELGIGFRGMTAQQYIDLVEENCMKPRTLYRNIAPMTYFNVSQAVHTLHPGSSALSQRLSSTPKCKKQRNNRPVLKCLTFHPGFENQIGQNTTVEAQERVQHSRLLPFNHDFQASPTKLKNVRRDGDRPVEGTFVELQAQHPELSPLESSASCTAIQHYNVNRKQSGLQMHYGVNQSPVELPFACQGARTAQVSDACSGGGIMACLRPNEGLDNAQLYQQQESLPVGERYRVEQALERQLEHAYGDSMNMQADAYLGAGRRDLPNQDLGCQTATDDMSRWNDSNSFETVPLGVGDQFHQSRHHGSSEFEFRDLTHEHYFAPTQEELTWLHQIEEDQRRSMLARHLFTSSLPTLQSNGVGNFGDLERKGSPAM